LQLLPIELFSGHKFDGGAVELDILLVLWILRPMQEIVLWLTMSPLMVRHHYDLPYTKTAWHFFYLLKRHEIQVT
jgi:hypothetical protein